MREEELAFLQVLARRVPRGGRIVEVGSWKGRSTVAIAEAVVGRGIEVWAIDTFTGDPAVRKEVGHVAPAEVYDTFARNTSRFPFVKVLRQASPGAAASFDDTTVDWIFIDGDHTYDAVLADILAWYPKITPAGLISGHDFGKHEGVTEAVMRAFRSFQCDSTIWHTRHAPRSPTIIDLRRRASRLRRAIRI